MSNIYFEIGHKNNNARIDRERLIFLEGTDDAYFLDHVLDQIKADSGKVGLVTVGGIGEFPSRIKGFSKTPNFTGGKVKAVSIVRDADDDFVKTNAEMKDLFKRIFGVDVSHGDVVLHDGISYGYFLMPGVSLSGDLERLCLSTVDGLGLEKQSSDFLGGLTNPPTDHIYKRKAQIYLAGYNGDLCRGAGLGFKRGYFDHTHESLEPFKVFLGKFVSEKI